MLSKTGMLNFWFWRRVRPAALASNSILYTSDGKTPAYYGRPAFSYRSQLAQDDS